MSTSEYYSICDNDLHKISFKELLTTDIKNQNGEVTNTIVEGVKLKELKGEKRVPEEFDLTMEEMAYLLDHLPKEDRKYVYYCMEDLKKVAKVIDDKSKRPRKLTSTEAIDILYRSLECCHIPFFLWETSLTKSIRIYTNKKVPAMDSDQPEEGVSYHGHICGMGVNFREDSIQIDFNILNTDYLISIVTMVSASKLFSIYSEYFKDLGYYLDDKKSSLLKLRDRVLNETPSLIREILESRGKEKPKPKTKTKRVTKSKVKTTKKTPSKKKRPQVNKEGSSSPSSAV